VSFFARSEFTALKLETTNALQACAVHHRFDSGQVIYFQNDRGRKLFFVGKGHVKLGRFSKNGQFTTFCYIPAGAGFGELSWIEPGIYHESAIAVGNIHLWSITFPNCRRLAEIDPAFGHTLERMIARRSAYFQEMIGHTSYQSLEKRLAETVLRVSKELDHYVMVDGRRCLTIGSIINQTELGQLARGSRGNVNRVLKAWERDNLIHTRERSIIVLDRNGLEAIVNVETDDE